MSQPGTGPHALGGPRYRLHEPTGPEYLVDELAYRKFEATVMGALRSMGCDDPAGIPEEEKAFFKNALKPLEHGYRVRYRLADYLLEHAPAFFLLCDAWNVADLDHLPEPPDWVIERIEKKRLFEVSRPLLRLVGLATPCTEWFLVAEERLAALIEDMEEVTERLVGPPTEVGRCQTCPSADAVAKLGTLCDDDDPHVRATAARNLHAWGKNLVDAPRRECLREQAKTPIRFFPPCARHDLLNHIEDWCRQAPRYHAVVLTTLYFDPHFFPRNPFQDRIKRLNALDFYRRDARIWRQIALLDLALYLFEQLGQNPR